MKYLFTLLLIISSGVFSDTNKYTEINTTSDFRVNGFRELRWDNSISIHEHYLIETKKGKDTIVYRYIDDNLRIGLAEIINLEYIFIDDQFVALIFVTLYSQNRIAIIDKLKLQFKKMRHQVMILNR